MVPLTGKVETMVVPTISAPGPVVKPAVTVPLIKLPAVSRTPLIVSEWEVLGASNRLGVRVNVLFPLESVRVTASVEVFALRVTAERLVGWTGSSNRT